MTPPLPSPFRGGWRSARRGEREKEVGIMPQSNRYQPYIGGISVTAGWKCTQLTAPSSLYGANGMRFGPDGRLYVAQAFGSQISAIDTRTGEVSVISPVGGPIVGPDD